MPAPQTISYTFKTRCTFVQTALCKYLYGCSSRLCILMMLNPCLFQLLCLKETILKSDCAGRQNLEGMWSISREKRHKGKYGKIQSYFPHKPWISWALRAILWRCTTWAGKWVRDQNPAFYPPCFTKAVVIQGESFSCMHSSSLTEIMHAAAFHSHPHRNHHNR